MSTNHSEPTQGLTFDSLLAGRRIGRFQIGIIVLCAIAAMIDGFDTQSIALAAPGIAAEFNAPLASFGPVFGIGLFGGLIGAIVGGILSDRVGRKPLLIISLAIVAVGSLLTPFVGSLGLLLALRFFTGLGLGGALPCVISLTGEYAPQRSRAALVALMFAGFPVGAVIGGLASAVLIPAFGWTSVFWFGGVVPLLLLPFVAVAVPESVRFLAVRADKGPLVRVLHRMGMDGALAERIVPEAAEPRAPFVRLFTGGRALGTVMLWIVLLLSLLMTYFLTNWIPIIAGQNGIDARSAILGAVMLNLGSVFGSIVLGRFVRRHPALVISGGYVLGAITIVLIGQTGSSAPALLITTLLTGFFAIGAQLCAVGLAATYYGDTLRATGVGAAVGVARLGAIVGPVLGGILIGASVATSAIFIVIGVVSLIAAIAMAVMGVVVLRRRPINPIVPTPIEAEAI